MLFYCCTQLLPLRLPSSSHHLRVVHCRCCRCVAVAPLMFLLRLPLPSLLSSLGRCCAFHCCCHCANHRCPRRCCCHRPFHCCRHQRCPVAVAPSITVAIVSTIAAVVVAVVVALTPSIAAANVAVVLPSHRPLPSPLHCRHTFHHCRRCTNHRHCCRCCCRCALDCAFPILFPLISGPPFPRN